MKYSLIVLVPLLAVATWYGFTYVLPSEDEIDTEESGSCEEQALLTYDCWTSRFPEEITDRSDVACSFAVSCCGEGVTDEWEMEFPDMAGLRGYVDNGSTSLGVTCDDLIALDVDNDGTENPDDTTPFGETLSPWKPAEE